MHGSTKKCKMEGVALGEYIVSGFPLTFESSMTSQVKREVSQGDLLVRKNLSSIVVVIRKSGEITYKLFIDNLWIMYYDRMRLN